MDKKQLILQYLDSKYGNCETYENEATITINGVCTYYKILKSVGFVGMAHQDLCDWFGDGRYHSIFADWFYEKYKMERKVYFKKSGHYVKNNDYHYE